MTNKFLFDSDSGLLRPVELTPHRVPRQRQRVGMGVRWVLVMLFVFVSSVFGVSVVRAITTSPTPAANAVP